MNAVMYPKECRKSIQRLTDEVGISTETAYAMLMITAVLMDLRPGDEQVLNIVLEDCGVVADD